MLVSDAYILDKNLESFFHTKSESIDISYKIYEYSCILHVYIHVYI